MSSLLFDLRTGWRALARRPGFSLTVVLTLGVAIGANVAAFVYLTYFTHPTVDAPHPGRLGWLNLSSEDDPLGLLRYAEWQELVAEGAATFDEVTAHRLFGASLQTADRTVHVWGKTVSGGYFGQFGAQPHLGRLLGPGDDRSEAERVMVLSHLTWTRHFAADPEVIGSSVSLDDTLSYTVVGVARPGFQGESIWAGVYVPLANAQGLVAADGDHAGLPVFTIVRLADGVTWRQAEGRLGGWLAGLEESFPVERKRRVRLRPLTEFDESWLEVPGYYAAHVLMVAVALLLGLGSASVANLLLAQGTARAKETCVHAALGAGRLVLARRLLVESLALSLAGGALGLLLARSAKTVIEAYLRGELPVGMGDFSAGTTLTVNETAVAAFLVAIAIATGLMAGLAPVLHTMRADLVSGLKGDATGGDGGDRARDFLLVTQLALSVVLLVGALLLGRTLSQLRQTELGFSSDGLLLASVYLPKQRLDAGSTGELYSDLLERAGALPGVEAATLTRRVPLQFFPTAGFTLPHSGEQLEIKTNVVSSGFFATLGVPILQGGDFSPSATVDGPHVAILSRAAAERYWPGSDPVGAELWYHPDGLQQPHRVLVVAAVASDYRYEPPQQEVEPLIYLPHRQHPTSRMTLMLRTRTPLSGALHRLLRDDYPDLAVIDLVPFSDQTRRALANERMSAHASGFLAALGLLLAVVGIFSVMSYTVTARTREIGIRTAIGASSNEILRWTLRRALRRVALGLGIGLVAALWLSRALASQLRGVEAWDPWTYLLVSFVIAASGVAAAWIPGRRAARLSPRDALRS